MEELFRTKAVLAKKYRARCIELEGCTGRDGLFLARIAVDDLVDRLQMIKRQFACAAVLHDWSGLAEAALGQLKQIDKLVSVSHPDAFGLVPFAPTSQDLIVSFLSAHEVTDLPGLFVQARQALKPDGLFLAVMPGGETLKELRQSLLRAELEISGGAQARVLPMVDVRDLGGLLQRAGFALPVTDVETYTANYDGVPDLIADLRSMGAGASLAGKIKPLRMEVLRRTDQIYRREFAGDGGRLPATFSFLWALGWAPDESQPRPLKPGTAKTNLKDVL